MFWVWIEIEDIFEEENEPALTITNDVHHEEAPDQHMLEIESDEDEEESHVLNENPVDVEDREEIAIPENNEGLALCQYQASCLAYRYFR